MPSEVRGGLEEYALRLSRSIAERAWNVSVGFPSRPDTSSLAEDFKSSRIQHYRLEIADTRFRRFSRVRRDLPNFLRTLSLIRRAKPDVVLIMLPNTFTCLGSILACGLLEQSTVVRFGLVLDQRKPRKVLRKLYQWAKNRSQQWVAVSGFDQRLLSEVFHIPKHQISCIPNGTTIADISEENLLRERSQKKKFLLNELRLPTSSTLILTVGRLEPQKGHIDVVNVMSDIVNRFSSVYFLWVGEGRLRKSLESELDSNGMLTRVRFMGYRSDVVNLMKACDVFLLPSHYEGSPSVLLEAMAQLLPIVSSNACGTSEIVSDHKTGVLFRKADRQDLLTKVLWALCHPTEMQKYASESRERVVEKYSLTSTVNRTISVLARSPESSRSH